MQNQKRGQFYLIAALIIIAVVVSLVVVYNVANVSEEDIKVYDLSSEINFEQSQVIDNGVFTGQDIDQNIKDLADIYQNLNPDIDFQIAYSTNVNICFLESEITSGTLGEERRSIGEKRCNNDEIDEDGGKIRIPIDGESLTFDLKPGQAFYLIVTKMKDGETFRVVSPQEGRAGSQGSAGDDED